MQLDACASAWLVRRCGVASTAYLGVLHCHCVDAKHPAALAQSLMTEMRWKAHTRHTVPGMSDGVPSFAIFHTTA